MRVWRNTLAVVGALGAMMALAYADEGRVSNGSEIGSLETSDREEVTEISVPGSDLDASKYATTTFRDWQVENPMTAGITKGLTLGVFPVGKYAQGAVIASEYDPFGMSRAVYQQVAAHGRTSHLVGQALGYGFWAFTLGGVFYRHLHRLKVDDLEKQHAT